MTSTQTMHRGETRRSALLGKITDRRKQRRHDLELQNLEVQRWDGRKHCGSSLGQLVDLSSGGIRIRTCDEEIRPEQQIRLRIQLPAYAGICPFVDTSGDSIRPRNDWVGWVAVSRVRKISDTHYEVAGRLMDMEELNRGMLRLYLSTQPLAA